MTRLAGNFGLQAVLGIVVLASACNGGDSRVEEPITTNAPSTTSPPTNIVAGEVTLAIEGDTGLAEGSIPITVTLTNGTDATVTLVRPTAIPNFIAFTVRDAFGNPMPFYGPHDRLRPLGDDGFVTLAAGEATSEQLDIGIGFLLDAGTYTVTGEYRNPAGGSHEGTRAIVFEPGQGPVSNAIEIVVTR